MLDLKQRFKPPYDLAGKTVDYPTSSRWKPTISTSPVKIENFHEACEQLNPPIEPYAEYEDYEFVVQTTGFDPSLYSPEVKVISELEFWQSVIYTIHNWWTPDYYFRVTPSEEFLKIIKEANEDHSLPDAWFDSDCSVSNDINDIITRIESGSYGSTDFKHFTIEIIEPDLNNCLIGWYYWNDSEPFVIKELNPMCLNTQEDYNDYMLCEHHYQLFATQLSSNINI